MDNERLSTENRNLSSRLSETDRLRGTNREFEVTITKITSENRYLVEENLKAQEGLRASTVALHNLSGENAELKRILDAKERDFRNINLKISEYEGVGKSVGGLNERINRLTFENEQLTGETRVSQERLRESALQSTRLVNELTEFKTKIERLTQENQRLVGDVREGQEKIRLSSSEMTRLVREIEEFKNRVGQHVQENEALKRKSNEGGELQRRLNEYERTIQELQVQIRSTTSKHVEVDRENTSLSKRLQEIDILGKQMHDLQSNIVRLSQENQALNSDYLSAQEGLRVSQSQTAKFSNELNEAKNKIRELEERLRRKTEECVTFESKITQSYNDIERFKKEGKNTAERFREIEKQAMVMGELQNKVIQLAKENEILINENLVVNDKLRLSTGELGKLRNENARMREELEGIRRELQSKGVEFQSIFSRGVHSEQETSRLTSELGDFRNRLLGLADENKDLAGQVREGQEKLRLSAGQVQKLVN